MLLRVHDLNVDFATHRGSVPAVRQVSFEIAEGGALGLVGESGSGKSATALAILRLLPPQARLSGNVLFDGAELLALPDDGMRAYRGQRISMIFQEPMTALNPVMRIGDQVAEAVLAHGRSDRAAAWGRAIESLRDVGIPEPERRARDYPHQLSGGQRQRVMIAMAIVNRPQLLIADEPTTALDTTVQAQILDLLRDLRRRFHLAMLFISHDLGVISQVADHVAVMYGGSIVELGPRDAVFGNPIHPYTRGLLGAVPTLRTDQSQPLRTIQGMVPAADDLPPGCPFEPRCDWRVPECAQAWPPLVEVGAGHLARCPVVIGQLSSTTAKR